MPQLYIANKNYSSWSLRPWLLLQQLGMACEERLVAFRVQTYGPALSPVAQDYAARLRALPPMQRWYADALAEPWRHAGHEAEARAAGETLQDLRTGA